MVLIIGRTSQRRSLGWLKFLAERPTRAFAEREEGVVDTGDRLLTPGEVAALFRVDPKTVTRWAAAGRISSIRTPGGHRRFGESGVRALLEGEGVLDATEARPPGSRCPADRRSCAGPPNPPRPPAVPTHGGRLAVF